MIYLLSESASDSDSDSDTESLYSVLDVGDRLLEVGDRVLLCGLSAAQLNNLHGVIAGEMLSAVPNVGRYPVKVDRVNRTLAVRSSNLKLLKVRSTELQPKLVDPYNNFVQTDKKIASNCMDDETKTEWARLMHYAERLPSDCLNLARADPLNPATWLSRTGTNLLSGAASQGLPRAMAYILAHAPELLNASDASGSGFTPLISAAYVGNEECVRLMLNAGACTTTKSLGCTAAEHARKQGHHHVASLITSASASCIDKAFSKWELDMADRSPLFEEL